MKEQVLILVHDVVGVPDKIRKPRGPQEEAQQAAEQGREPGVEQVLGHDDGRRIAHGLERADLGALLVHHARHGGDADQRRHQHEEHREHHRDAVDDGAVVLKGHIAGIGRAVKGEELRPDRIFQLRLALGEFLLRVFQLLPGIRELALGLFLPLLVLIAAVGQLLLRLFHPGAAGLQGRAGHVQLHLFRQERHELFRVQALQPVKALRDAAEIRNLNHVQALQQSREPGLFKLPLQARERVGKLIQRLCQVRQHPREGLHDLAEVPGLQRPGVVQKSLEGIEVNGVPVLTLKGGVLFVEITVVCGEIGLVLHQLRPAGVQGVLGGLKLLLTLGEFLRRLLQAEAVLGPAVVQLLPRTEQFFAVLPPERLRAQQAPPVQQRLDRGAQTPQGVGVFLGINLPRQVQPEQQLVIHLVREGRGGQQHKAGGPAGTELAAPAVDGDIARTAGDPDQGEVPPREVLQGLFAVGIREDNVPPEVLFFKYRGIPQALVRPFRHAAQQKLRHGDLLRQGLKVPDLFLALPDPRVGVGKTGALCRVHARKPSEGGGVGLLEAEAAHELKIVHLLPPQIVVRRAQHVRLGALEPGVEAHAQRRDGEDREEAPEGGADAPQEHFPGFAVHALTTRSLRPGSRGDSHRRTGRCRS